MNEIAEIVGGIRIFCSDLLDDFKTEPVRIHRDKGQSSYSRRVQKKWVKRFGTHEVRYFIYANNAIYCSPNNVEVIRKQLDHHSE